jgi:hypothetical protein
MGLTQNITQSLKHTQSPTKHIYRTSKGYDFKYMQYSEKVFQHLIKQHTCAILLTLRWYLVITRTAKYPENSPWIKNNNNNNNSDDDVIDACKL